tara:strand:+ start:30831 stop:31037 length:207 start_codon:yes stop_codon:yes gene_type:complete
MLAKLINGCHTLKDGLNMLHWLKTWMLRRDVSQMRNRHEVTWRIQMRLAHAGRAERRGDAEVAGTSAA